MNSTIPLIIDGQDVVLQSGERQFDIPSPDANGYTSFQGATKQLAIQAAESSARAFASWFKTKPVERRELLQKLAQIFKSKVKEVEQICVEEIHCDAIYAQNIAQDGLDLIEECAALTTSAVLGSIPSVRGDGYGLVFKEPLGVILGIAPWNAPIILGLRAVIAPIAAGNTAILKGSELSPRVHYFLASLFREAGFPPGVVNFLLHGPRDGAEIFDALIKHRAIRKCNFTGSTQVGRIIAAQAAMALKPVLLELGGKNFVIVLDDANLDLAAQEIIKGAFLNNGQICMSTDLIISTKGVAVKLEEKLLGLLQTVQQSGTVITAAAKMKLDALVKDAIDKGAKVYTAPVPDSSSNALPQSFIPTIITDLKPEMAFYETESFGPLCGLITVEDENRIIEIAEQATYGLSAAIFSNNHYKALKLAESIKSGAIHINSMTVHDEATLPHGGHCDSGWGRFGSQWGLQEFLQTKTVTLHQ
ncbi:Aldehyde/histidinol dehydrogenase [Penicillium occitanis (nom. inval.)]|nr:hypothetical protein PENOC_032250 [Penicillium occitanis (nom. inval.)]PCH09034.1 Aldehyde/histidinol dehydrogenase [Penicillium occitanis (nom. inval.)]